MACKLLGSLKSELVLDVLDSLAIALSSCIGDYILAALALSDSIYLEECLVSGVVQSEFENLSICIPRCCDLSDTLDSKVLSCAQSAVLSDC